MQEPRLVKFPTPRSSQRLSGGTAFRRPESAALQRKQPTLRQALLGAIVTLCLACASLPAITPSQALAFTSSYSVETTEFDGLYVQLPLGPRAMLFYGNEPLYMPWGDQGRDTYVGYAPYSHERDLDPLESGIMFLFGYLTDESESDQQELLSNPGGCLTQYAQNEFAQNDACTQTTVSEPIELRGNADAIHLVATSYTDESGTERTLSYFCITDNGRAWVFKTLFDDSSVSLSAIEGIACSASTNKRLAQQTNPLARYIDSFSLAHMDGWADELGNVETEGVQFRMPAGLGYDHATTAGWDFWSTDDGICIGVMTWDCPISIDSTAAEFETYRTISYMKQDAAPTFLERPRAYEINGLITYVAHYEDAYGEGYHVDVLTPTGKILDFNCYYQIGANTGTNLGETVLDLIGTLQPIE